MTLLCYQAVVKTQYFRRDADMLCCFCVLVFPGDNDDSALQTIVVTILRRVVVVIEKKRRNKKAKP